MFEFWIDDVLVGRSKLTRSDPSMGVASGQFIPTKNFEKFRTRAEHLDSGFRQWSNCSVKANDGRIVQCSAGAVIVECGPEEDIFGLEATCLGVEYPSYEELFPHHDNADG